MSKVEEIKTAKEVRNSIGGDVIIAMLAHDEFPVSNVRRLSMTMQEYFISEGFEDSLVELGYRWRPDVDYWRRHLPDVREYLRKEKKLFLEYVGVVGESAWCFIKKHDFKIVMVKEATGLGTRTETYNDRNDDGNDKWPSLKSPSVRLALIEAG